MSLSAGTIQGTSLTDAPHVEIGQAQQECLAVTDSKINTAVYCIPRHSERVAQEICTYLHLLKVGIECSPLEWWKAQEKQLTLLSR